jgi:hypothetical protein
MKKWYTSFLSGNAWFSVFLGFFALLDGIHEVVPFPVVASLLVGSITIVLLFGTGIDE